MTNSQDSHQIIRQQETMSLVSGDCFLLLYSSQTNKTFILCFVVLQGEDSECLKVNWCKHGQLAGLPSGRSLTKQF